MATKKQIETARRVAEALATVNPLAGQDFRVTAPQNVQTRTANLLKPHGTHGAYVQPGDPHEWGGPGVLATIYMEQIGSPDDCYLPLDYYEGGLDFSIQASDLLRDCFIEFVNPAVASVYPV